MKTIHWAMLSAIGWFVTLIIYVTYPEIMDDYLTKCLMWTWMVASGVCTGVLMSKSLNGDV